MKPRQNLTRWVAGFAWMLLALLWISTASAMETTCFDGADNDGDGFTDCTDPDCLGAVGDSCSTGQPGICEPGTTQCIEIDGDLQQACVADTLPQTEGPVGDPTCVDTLDNDCDSFTDAADPDCETAVEFLCFDGIDNDGDGLTDCADPNCNLAQDAVCDTGLPGVCGPGRITCLDLEEICFSDDPPQPEVPDALTCNDNLDNDCDGFTDENDPSCVAAVEVCDVVGDEDNNGLADCADPACDQQVGPQGQTCEPNGETLCADSFDNDADTLADCNDLDCVDAPNCVAPTPTPTPTSTPTAAPTPEPTPTATPESTPSPTPTPAPTPGVTVEVCHNGTTKVIDAGSLDKHLKHGDTLGPCPSSSPTPAPTSTPTPSPTPAPSATPTPGATVEVCHRGTTKTIDAAKLETHLNHGDTLGPCASPTPPPTPTPAATPTTTPTPTPAATPTPTPGGTVEVCHNGRTKTIDQSELGTHLDHGDTLGPCS